jgi:hypothetical protein
VQSEIRPDSNASAREAGTDGRRAELGEDMQQSHSLPPITKQQPVSLVGWTLAAGIGVALWLVIFALF